jgi:two-component system response regulator AtoC
MIIETVRESAGRVLLVEDDDDMRGLIQRWLEGTGHRVASFADAEACLAVLPAQPVLAVCLDVGLPGMGGVEALVQIHARLPQVPVVMLTGVREVTTVVEAMRAGAYDYIPKPLDQDKVRATLLRAIESGRAARSALGESRVPAGMIARSPAMLAVLGQMARVAASDVNVLVFGESGTGKELAARAIHAGSSRASGPFVAVNCAAVPEALMESEFFGHEKGSFTGASGQRQGRVEQADGGTLFLDEIGELRPELQAKLLRVIQERRFHRVGGSAEVRADFRLVTATHQDLSAAIEEGRFREDLYYRIAVFELDLPPLRERTGDVDGMVQSFVASLGGGRSLEVDPETLALLERYAWPGNVRELHNVIQRAVVMCDGPAILPHHLPARLHRTGGADEPAPTSTRMEDLERDALTRSLARHGGNVNEVVRELGIGRTTVYRKMKELNLRRGGAATPGRFGTRPR